MKIKSLNTGGTKVGGSPDEPPAGGEIHVYGIEYISAPVASVATGKQSRAKRTFVFRDKNGDDLRIVAYADDARNLKLHVDDVPLA